MCQINQDSISPMFLIVAFAPIFLFQRRMSLNSKYQKAAHETFVQKKMCKKCWWNCQIEIEVDQMFVKLNLSWTYLSQIVTID
jgi:hypothetical protein